MVQISFSPWKNKKKLPNIKFQTPISHPYLPDVVPTEKLLLKHIFLVHYSGRLNRFSIVVFLLKCTFLK